MHVSVYIFKDSSTNEEFWDTSPWQDFFPDISLTCFKFPDISRFSRQVVTRNSLLKGVTGVLQPKIAKNSLKTPILGVQGRSRSSMFVPVESSSVVLVMISSKSASICNGSLARLDDSSRNRTFWRGYPNLMHSYGGLLESKGSNLTLLKSTFNAEHFIRTLLWSILNGFGAIHSLKYVYRSLKLWEIH